MFSQYDFFTDFYSKHNLRIIFFSYAKKSSKIWSIFWKIKFQKAEKVSLHFYSKQKKAEMHFGLGAKNVLANPSSTDLTVFNKPIECDEKYVS